MRAPMSLAALVDMPPEDLRAWTDEGLLDPDRRERYNELDLLRLMTIRHYGALGYSPAALAQAIAAGEVEPFLADYMYPRGPQLSIEQAAERLGLDAEALLRLRTTLGFTRDKVLEDDLKLFEAFHVMSAAGMPFEAVLEGARVFGDALRRLAETETRLVHVHIHERLEEHWLMSVIARPRSTAGDSTPACGSKTPPVTTRPSGSAWSPPAGSRRAGTRARRRA